MLQKVSVVVPIYNVEKYINRCIDSILNQSYKNLQVILIDDGSPDRCGTIADNYAKKDGRVEVIHKSNGGLSDARNFGIEKIVGEFTLFVDSDDWLETDMIRTMVEAINKFDADVVQTAFYYAYKEYLLFDDRHYLETDSPVILNNNELMYELIVNEKVKNFAWGKLYKTQLIKDTPFRKGVLFEDVFWAHKVMSRVNKYVIIHKPLCYYLQREDSIVSTYTVRNLDILIGLEERHKFVEENYKEFIGESYNLILKTSLLNYNLLLLNKEKDKDSINRKRIKKYINENYKELKASIKENDKGLKLQLFLFKVHPALNVLVVIKNKLLRILKLKKGESGLKRIDL